MAKAKKFDTMGELFGKDSNIEEEFDFEEKNVNSSNGIVCVPISELHEFKNHPFKVIDNEEMDELVESIKKKGIIYPILCRPKRDGGFEIIAGHRRKHAAELAGLQEVPVTILDIDDDEAAIIMVDSNVQRNGWLPSEKAKAYKIKMEALNRQGKKSGTNEKINSAEEIGKSNNDSARQVFRYIKLTKLNQTLLDLVDAGKIPTFSVGEPLASLDEDEQNLIVEFYNIHSVLPNADQIKRIKLKSEELKKSGQKLDSLIISEILKVEKSLKVVLKPKTLKEYFPIGTSEREMEEIIIGLLEKWKLEQGNE